MEFEGKKLPPEIDFSSLPPKWDYRDFGADELESTRLHAVALLDSGILGIDEEFSLNDIIERCEALLARKGVPVTA
jgi:hypothetical protein